MHPTRLWLSRDWFVCCAGAYLVCFDTKEGRYQLISAEAANTLKDHVFGWPLIELAENGESPPSSGRQGVDLKRILLDKGVLVPDARRGKAATPVCVQSTRDCLLGEYEDLKVKLRASDVLMFAVAATSSGWTMSLRKEKQIPKGVVRQIVRHKLSLICDRELLEHERIEAKRLLATFLRLRPLLWKSADQNLFERLVLLRFLKYYGLQPRWVFGVSVEPFQYYSWLQFGSTVIDDSPGRTKSLVPIMMF